MILLPSRCSPDPEMLPSRLIRNGLAMGQYYHRTRRENRKPALTP